jgi:hypothetical protein
MGADVGRHASSIEKMHHEVLTLYVDEHRLAATRPARRGVTTQALRHRLERRNLPAQSWCMSSYSQS